MKKVYEIIKMDLDNDVIDFLVKFGHEKIKDDKEELISYAVNYILKDCTKKSSKLKKK